MYGKHLPENSITVWWVGRQKIIKKKGKEQIYQVPIAPRDLISFAIGKEIDAISLLSYDRLLTMQHHLMEYDWQPPPKKEL